MTEILTESFCERCGTRYTFESERPRTRLKSVKVLSRGLKNFVMSDETSMDEAMAAARSETDRELTTHQLDAFHKTFNFCMSCRQYTCPNCWNEVEARCLSCAPHLGHEVLPAPFPDMPVTPAFLRTANGTNGSNGSAHPVELVGAAEIGAVRRDEEVDAAARLAALTGATAATPVADADVANVDTSDIQHVDTSDIPYLNATEPPAVDAVAGIPYVDTSDIPYLNSTEPPAIVDVPPLPEAAAVELVAAPEAEAEAVELAAEPALPTIEAAAEPDSAPAAVVEPVAQAVVEPAAATGSVAATDAPDDASRLAEAVAAAFVAEVVTPDEPTPPALSVEDKAVAQTSGLFQRFRPGQSLDAELEAYEREHRTDSDGAAATDLAAAAAVTPQPPAEPDVPEPAPAVDDVVPQPVWRMVAPDPATEAPVPPAHDAPAMPAAASASAPNAEPQWPAQPQWPSATPANGLPFLGRPAAPQGGLEALWAESNREVVATPAAGRTSGVVQPCVSCGLSLSATAKFCRRCGTPQGG